MARWRNSALWTVFKERVPLELMNQSENQTKPNLNCLCYWLNLFLCHCFLCRSDYSNLSDHLNRTMGSKGTDAAIFLWSVWWQSSIQSAGNFWPSFGWVGLLPVRNPWHRQQAINAPEEDWLNYGGELTNCVDMNIEIWPLARFQYHSGQMY